MQDQGEVKADVNASAASSMTWRGILRALRDALFRVPGVRVFVLAMKGYIVHQSANQAGSVAFSSILAMFPLLILVSSAAGFLGKPGDAAALAGKVIGYTPPVVQNALQPVVDQVLSQRNQALLAIGFFVTIWTASSGVQAIRTALNKAYGIEAGLTFWKARIKVTLFTIIVGSATIAAFSSVVIMPYVWQFLENTIGVGAEAWWLRGGVRYGLAFAVLAPMYAVLYGFLPDIPQTFRAVLPGALFGAGLWVALAALLSYSWRSAAELLLVYGGFAGLVATLVFLYLSTVTLILGAEVNAVLRGEADAVKADAVKAEAVKAEAVKTDPKQADAR